jgi:hypothetical protein
MDFFAANAMARMIAVATQENTTKPGIPICTSMLNGNKTGDSCIIYLSKMNLMIMQHLVSCQDAYLQI